MRMVPRTITAVVLGIVVGGLVAYKMKVGNDYVLRFAGGLFVAGVTFFNAYIFLPDKKAAK